MIKFHNVCKKFNNGFEALHRINLHISKGEMVFLTGHSGAGKSTLLKLITLLEIPSTGHISVAGQKLEKISPRQIPYLRRKIGLILQNPMLLPKRTVFENVALPLIVSGYNYDETNRSVHAALDVVGLLTKERRYPLSLSAGEQQRINIARAIVNRPLMLLADEPTGNLDPSLASDTMQLFDQLNKRGTTMLIASHDLTLITSLHHRILTLNQGRLVNA